MSSIIVSSTQASTISISAPQVNTISITAPAQRVINGTINLGSAGTPGQGVAAGGTTGQSLVKASGANYDTTWADRLASVQEDTTPHLGGDLDVQTHSITTDSANQNINIVANGTGYINLDGAVKIKNQATPSVIEGGLYADTSGNIYFGDDTAWKKVLLEDGSVGADLITITTADGDVDAQEKIRISDGTNSDDVVIEAGTNMSISRSGDTITLTNTLSNTTLTQEEVEDYAGGLIDSTNSGDQTGITVTYQDATNDVDFVVDDQTLQASDSEGDQTVVRLTMSQPTVDDTVDITAGDNIVFTAIGADGFTIGADGTASDVSLTDESADTTCFPVFGTSATGDQTLHTDASGLTYNSSTETLEVKNLKVNDASNPYTLPSADGDDGQVLTTAGDGTVSFAYPKTVGEDVKNVDTGTLTKGTPVHVTGSTGQQANVVAADATTNYPAHFVLAEDITANGSGKGVVIGFVKDISVTDASNFPEGDTLYLSSTAGEFTTTKPTGSNKIQNIGIVIKSNTGNNTISAVIMGAGRVNDVPNLTDGKFFIGSATNTVESAYTMPTADGSANQILSTDGSGAVSFTTNSSTGLSDVSDTAADAAGEILIWDNTNNEFVANSITGGSNITVTNGDGTISVASDISNTTDLTDVDNSAADAAGEVLIWNNSTTKFVPNTLTAGTGISITNGDGSITIANTVSDTNTNISNGDLTATGSHVYDINGETQEIDVNGGVFKIDDLTHRYLRAEGGDLELQGLQYPASDGTSGQALTTNGAGVLSFSTFPSTDTNLGNTDQTLSGARTIDLDGNTLTFDGVESGVASISNTGQAEFRRRLTIKGYGGGSGSLRINNSDDSYGVNIQPPNLSDNYTLVLPTTNGDADQVLTTNGLGVLSWEDSASTDTNLGNTDQTLSADRTVEMSSNDIIFESSSTEKARIASTGVFTGTRRVVVEGLPSGGGEIKLGDGDNSSFITLTAPSVLSSNVDLTLPDADGTSGQVLQTDGSGNLSFDDDRAFPKPFAVLSGRFQFDADDDNRTILCGSSSFGTNYYLWNTELFDTIDNGTIDTTTQGISVINSGSSLKMPEAAKITWEVQCRSINSNTYAKDFRAQIWSASSIPSSGSQVAWTLRGDKAFTSLSTTSGWFTMRVNTTSEIPEGHYVLFCVGLDDETISTTTYLGLQSTVILTK